MIAITSRTDVLESWILNLELCFELNHISDNGLLRVFPIAAAKMPTQPL